LNSESHVYIYHCEKRTMALNELRIRTHVPVYANIASDGSNVMSHVLSAIFVTQHLFNCQTPLLERVCKSTPTFLRPAVYEKVIFDMDS
jgi:hypothetical protein